MERYMLKHGSMDTYRSSETNEKYSETTETTTYAYAIHRTAIAQWPLACRWA